MNDALNKELCIIMAYAMKNNLSIAARWIGRHIRAEEDAARPKRKRKVRLGSGDDKVRGGDFYMEPGKLKDVDADADAYIDVDDEGKYYDWCDDPTWQDGRGAQ